MDEKIPFTEWVQSLKNDEAVTIPSLFRLSDMAADEWQAFQDVWPTIDDERRRIIARHLADISEDSFQVDFTDFFAMGLNDSAAPVRLASLDGLWDSEEISLIRPIIELMQDDPDVEVRAKAAGALGHFVVIGEWEIISPKETEPIVVALLAQMDNPNTADAIRRSALESLGAAYHPRVAELIKSAFESKNYRMQVSAVCAMGNSTDSQWTPFVIEEFEHPDAEMRFMAARAAGQIGSSDSVEGLIVLLDDEDLEVQLAAIGSLGEIGGDLAREMLENLANDPEIEGEMLEAVEEALEEISMMSGFGDLSLLDYEDDDDADGNWLPFKGEA